MKPILLASCAALLLHGTTAAAQPSIALSATVVSPGQIVNVMVSGGSGQFYAVIGSSVNSGFSFAGVPLGVGPDVVILAMGTLSGSGTAVVPVMPPFNGTILDRYYLQAATSTSPDFSTLQPSAVGVVRNGDLVAGLTGPQGSQGLQGPQGPQGPPGLSGLQTVQVGGTAAPHLGGGAIATCPSGKRVTGGGASSQHTSLRVYTSAPNGSTAWSVTFARDAGSLGTDTSASFQVYAICATVSP